MHMRKTWILVTLFRCRSNNRSHRLHPPFTKPCVGTYTEPQIYVSWTPDPHSSGTLRPAPLDPQARVDRPLASAAIWVICLAPTAAAGPCVFSSPEQPGSLASTSPSDCWT